MGKPYPILFAVKFISGEGGAILTFEVLVNLLVCLEMYNKWVNPTQSCLL